MVERATFASVWIAIVVATWSSISFLTAFFFASIAMVVIHTVADFYFTRDSSFSLALSLKKYISWRIDYIKGYFLVRKLDADTKNIRQCQDTSLKNILQYNSDTEYYNKWNLNNVATREDFTRIHPLIKFSHLEPYNDRMLKGEDKVLTSEDPLYYAVTSGTTGRPSRIPILPRQIENIRKFRSVLLYKVGNIVHGARALSRSMKLYYNVQRLLDKSATGVPLGPASASSDLFDFNDIFTTPQPGFDIPHEESTRYIHLLFGLKNRKLRKIETIFISIVYSAFVHLEAEWKSLVSDIRSGTLRNDLDIAPETRAKLLASLKPDKERAHELEKEFSKGFKNIGRRIWPDLEVIEAISSGPFVHYANALKHQYTGDVLIYSTLYGASEGIFGCNFWPGKKPDNYFLWPYDTFYEFIPIANVTEPVPNTVFMDQLEKGEKYEIVLTTLSGLYRYRLGDIVKIVDFYNQCPVIEFLYRTGQLLNLKGEKVSEDIIWDCLKEVLDTLDVAIERIVDFTSFESLVFGTTLSEDQGHKKSSVPYYVILAELTMTETADYRALEKEIGEKLDVSMLKHHFDYNFYRSKLSLEKLEFHLLKPGAFIRLRTFMLEHSTTAPSQLKLPKVLRKDQLIQHIWSERLVQ